MAGIYCADIYCDDCVEDIKDRILYELWEDCETAETPSGDCTRSDFSGIPELKEYLENMDERDYDSDAYPKYCPDDEESDGPQHCGSGADCLNPVVFDDGSKIGHCFGNSLTSEGVENIKEKVRGGGRVAELWRKIYDWVDFPNQCDNCGDDCDSDYLCDLCIESECADCGEFDNWNDDGECKGCAK